MGEREGTPQDFLHLLGRSTEPEQEVEPKPDETPEPPVEDPLLAALRGEDEWAKAFVALLHPEEKP